MLAPIYNAVNKLLVRWTAAKAAYLDAAVTSRAPASTALSNVNWTDGRAAKLDNMDAAVTTRAAASDYTSGRATKLDYLDVAISSRMAGIKRIQRGTVTIASGQTSGTATLVYSVDTDKTELRWLGSSSSVTGEGYYRTRIALTNATTITATRAASTSESVIASWELTEFN